MKEISINRLATVQNYLANTPEPNHVITDEYTGMHLAEFVKKFRCFNIRYPYKDNTKQYLIELQEKDCVTACQMVDNICINAYIFSDN